MFLTFYDLPFTTYFDKGNIQILFSPNIVSEKCENVMALWGISIFPMKIPHFSPLLN